MSLYVTTPVVGIGVAMFKAASDAEESQNRFNEVFKGIEKQAAATQKSLSQSYGLASVSSQTLLSDVGDLLTGIGLSKDESLEFGKSVISLSADIASFKNVQGGTERVTTAVTKALLGEREMLKDATKTAILEKDVKEKANKILRTRRDLTMQQAKALATLEILTERNTAAIGDYGRTSQGAANQQREFAENLKEMSVLFGQVILPKVTKALRVMNEWLKSLRELSPATRNFIVYGALLAATLGPVLFIFGQLGFAIAGIAAALPVLIPIVKAFTGAIIVLSKAMLFLATNPIGLVITGIAALAAAAYLIYNNWEPIRDFFITLWDDVVGAFNDALGWIEEKLTAFFNMFGKIKGLVSGIFGDSTTTGASSATNALPNGVDISPQGGRFTADINIANAPQGTNVTTDTQGSLESQVSVGHQLARP